MPNQPPPVLLYDQSAAKPNRPESRLFYAYWLGQAIGTLLWIPVCMLVNSHSGDDPTFGRVTDILIKAGGSFFLFEFAPSTFFMGFSIWIKRKIYTHVRLARPRTCFLAGLASGIVSPTLGMAFFTGDAQMIFFLAALGFQVLYPIIAGQFLCYRSHVRDD